MSIEEELFKETKIDFDKLLKYGFKKDKSLYKFSKNIMNNAFKVVIEINCNGIINGKVYDLSFDEEYTNFRIKDNVSSFANKVKDEYINLLKDIKDNCFIKQDFIYDQTNRIAKLIKDKYEDDPEFIWEKFPGYAVFRNKNSNKWYGIIMDIEKSKLIKNCSEKIEVINVKLKPDKIEYLLTQKGFYPAYHMNKKSWITIVLDDVISDENITSLIEESYSYTK